MKRLTVVILLLVLTTNLFGQKSEIENLINQIKSELVPPNFEYFNLVDISSKTYFDENSLEKYELIALLRDYSDFSVDSFIEKSMNCMLVNWNDFDLNNVKIYSAATIPKFESQTQFYTLLPFNTPQSSLDILNEKKNYNEVIVPIKKSWSKKRIDKKVSKAQKENANRIKDEDKIYFRFSSPLMIGNYTIITLAKSSSSATYIFHKENDTWEKILTFNRVKN